MRVIRILQEHWVVCVIDVMRYIRVVTLSLRRVVRFIALALIGSLHWVCEALVGLRICLAPG